MASTVVVVSHASRMNRPVGSSSIVAPGSMVRPWSTSPGSVTTRAGAEPLDVGLGGGQRGLGGGDGGGVVGGHSATSWA